MKLKRKKKQLPIIEEIIEIEEVSNQDGKTKDGKDGHRRKSLAELQGEDRTLSNKVSEILDSMEQPETPIILVKEQPEPEYLIKRDGLTQSMINTWLICPQKAKLAYLEMLDGGVKKSAALEFGEIFHNGLDKVYSIFRENLDEADDKSQLGAITISINGAMDEIYFNAKKEFAETGADISVQQDYELNHGTAAAMLRAYFKRWGNDFSEMNWVDLEKVFEVEYELPFPVSYTMESIGKAKYSIPLRGKFDGVFRDKNGKLWLFETKTKRDTENTVIPDTLHYNVQAMMYLLAIEQVYGEKPVGVCYNLVRRPQLRKKVTENLKTFLERIEADINNRPDEYFSRYNAAMDWSEVLEWKGRDFDPMIEQIYSWAKGEYNYRNQNSCFYMGCPCKFIPICARNDKSGFTKRLSVFPELEPKPIPETAEKEKENASNTHN